MSSKNREWPDTETDLLIKDCILAEKSFATVAGAGSGKTTSLVKALAFTRAEHGQRLKQRNQRIACITYTNRAVDVIRSRLHADDLFCISTLHGFLWGEIKNFQSDIREIFRTKLLPLKISEKSLEIKGKSKVAE